MDFSELVDIARLHPKLAGVEDFELCLQSIRSAQHSIQKAELKSEVTESLNWLSLRLIQRRQPGVSVCGTTTSDDFHQLVDRAMASSALSTPDPWFRFPLWRQSLDIERLPEITELKLPYYANSDPTVCIEESRCTWSNEIHLYRKTERKTLTNRDQFLTSHLRLKMGEHGATSLSVLKNIGQENSYRLDPNFIPVFRELARAEPYDKPPESGQVLLSAQAASQVILFMSPLFTSESRLLSESHGPLPVLSPHFNLCDDGRNLRGILSCPFDLEGVSTQKTVLVNQGRIVGFLCDATEASRFNRPGTGNRFRLGSENLPRTRPTTLCVTPGNLSPKELYSAVNHGMVIHSIDKMTLVAADKLRFSAMGWLVEKKNSLRAFSSIILEIKPLEALRYVVGVGNDVEYFGQVGCPSILFEKMPLY